VSKRYTVGNCHCEMAEGSEDRGGHQTLPHPWPYLEEVFEIVGSKNDSWCMRCKLCQPKNHVLSAFKNSPSNLKKHIEVSSVLLLYYNNGRFKMLATA
jgi:hypothetical protein